MEHETQFSTSVVDSYVKGKRISLIRQFLSDLLGVRNEEPPFEQGKTSIVYDPKWVFETALHKFYYGRRFKERLVEGGM